VEEWRTVQVHIILSVAHCVKLCHGLHAHISTATPQWASALLMHHSCACARCQDVTTEEVHQGNLGICFLFCKVLQKPCRHVTALKESSCGCSTSNVVDKTLAS
jgi:hypothetical protein